MLAAATNLRHLLTLDPCDHPCLGRVPRATSSVHESRVWAPSFMKILHLLDPLTI